MKDVGAEEVGSIIVEPTTCRRWSQRSRAAVDFGPRRRQREGEEGDDEEGEGVEGVVGRKALKRGAVVEQAKETVGGQEEANLDDDRVVNGDEVTDDKRGVPSTARPHVPYRRGLSGKRRSAYGI